jgi:ParE toxin of type II toxin-antitoxin system, parDE
MDVLLQYPLSGAVTDDPTIRRVTTTPFPYVIFYEVTDDEIVIHAVRHGARDPYDNPGSTLGLFPRGVSAQRLHNAALRGDVGR